MNKYSTLIKSPFDMNTLVSPNDRSIQVTNIERSLRADPGLSLVVTFIDDEMIVNDPLILDLIKSGIFDPAEVLDRSVENQPVLVAQYHVDTKLFRVFFVDPDVDCDYYYLVHEVGGVTFRQHLLSLSGHNTSATLFRV